MDDRFIPSLAPIRPRPFSDAVETRSIVRRTALAATFYVIFVIYPAYELLPWWWLPDYTLFSLTRFVTAVVTGIVFGWYVQRSILGRLRVKNSRTRVHPRRRTCREPRMNNGGD